MQDASIKQNEKVEKKREGAILKEWKLSVRLAVSLEAKTSE